MASDDESVTSVKTSIKLDSDPPRLTEKEKRLRKGDLERSFRVETRSLKDVSRRLLTACSDDDASLVDLDHLNREYNSSLKSVHSRFDELSSFCGGLVDPILVASLEKIDDDSLDFVPRIQNSIKLAKLKSQEESQGKSSSRSGFDFNFDDDREDVAFKRFMQSMCNQASLGRLAAPEPEVFSGDPLQFLSWKNSFKTLIDCRAIPQEERIYYLRKYVSGDAKQCIDCFLSLCTPEAYEEALALLEDRFGSDFVVANSLKQKLNKWPRIRNDDFVGLRKFSDYLHQVEVAKRSMYSMRFLDDEQENRNLLLKLPDWCRTRWARKVAEAKMDSMNDPGFSKFVKFVKVESDIAHDPITCGSSSSSS